MEIDGRIQVAHVFWRLRKLEVYGRKSDVDLAKLVHYQLDQICHVNQALKLSILISNSTLLHVVWNPG